MRKEPNPSCQYVRQRWVRLSLQSFKVSFPQTNKHKLASITSDSPFKHQKKNQQQRVRTLLKRRKQPQDDGSDSRFTGCGLDCFLRGILASRCPASRSARRATARTRTHGGLESVRPSVRQPGSQLTACHHHHHHHQLLPLPLPPTDTSSGGVIASRLHGHQTAT